MIVMNGSSTAFSGKPVIFNSHRPQDGVSIAVSGYPLSEPALVTNAGSVATTWSMHETKPNGRSFNSYLGDVQVNPGNSGGPVYLVDDGSVIGVCVAYKSAPLLIQSSDLGIRTNSGLTVIVPTEYVIEMLKKNSIEFDSVSY